MDKKAARARAWRRPRVDVPVTQLFLDKENPRLPEDAQGKPELAILEVLHNKFNLDEIAYSMAQNGYFDEEPLVGVPRGLPKKLQAVDPTTKQYQDFIKHKDTKFVVVEGNRRLATAKLLLDQELRRKFGIRAWPELDTNVARNLKTLPIIIYSRRNEVVPYLGVRHIVGIQKWDSYARARYVAKMVRRGLSINAIQQKIGDRQNSARKYYLCFKLIEQVEDEFDLDTDKAKADFSLLMLATGGGNIKRFLGLPVRIADADLETPVAQSKLNNLRNLISWLFGDGRNDPVIHESRDITNYLAHVVASSEAIAHLERTRILVEAYDLSDGEETMLLKYLSAANLKLQGALGIAHRHKTVEVIGEAEKCAKTATRLVKTLQEPDD